MEKKVIELGFYDSGTGKHQSNTVYFSKGMMPTMTTIGGGTYQIKVLRKVDMNNQDDIILGTNERTNERTRLLYSERLAIQPGRTETT